MLFVCALVVAGTLAIGDPTTTNLTLTDELAAVDRLFERYRAKGWQF